MKFQPGSSRLQQGFTLIELVAVIVLLGILAVTALPRFINISDDANRATAQSFMAAFRSGAQMLNMKWIAAGEPASVVSQGQTIEYSASGWPMGSVATHAGCAELWGELLDSAPAVSAFPVVTSEWTSFGNPVLCAYFNNRQQPLFANMSYFIYFHTTAGANTAGTFLRFNMD